VKWLTLVLVLLLLLLQYRLWFGDGSVQAFWALREEAHETRAELLRLRGRNQALEAEVADLKSGLDAIEERARTDLGMIDEDETFYQFVREQGAEQNSAAKQAAIDEVDGVRKAPTVSNCQYRVKTETDHGDLGCHTGRRIRHPNERWVT